MKGQRFYSDNHKERYLYNGINTPYRDGKGFINGDEEDLFFRLLVWNAPPKPQYKVENTEWNIGNGFYYTGYTLFGSKTGGIWEWDKPSDAIFHVKMNIKDRFKRWISKHM